MQNCFLYFRSEILETIGGAQQMCFQPFLSHLENSLSYLLLLWELWRCYKVTSFKEIKSNPHLVLEFWITIVRSSKLLGL
jgi:hypothetical protein